MVEKINSQELGGGKKSLGSSDKKEGGGEMKEQ